MKFDDWRDHHQRRVRAIAPAAARILVETRSNVAAVRQRKDIPPQSFDHYEAQERDAGLGRLKALEDEYADAVNVLGDRVRLTLGKAVKADPLFWKRVEMRLDTVTHRALGAEALINEAAEVQDLDTLRAIRLMGPAYLESKGERWPDHLTRLIDSHGGGPDDADKCWALKDWLAAATYRVGKISLPSAREELRPDGLGSEAGVLPSAEQGDEIATNEQGRKALAVEYGR